VAKSTFLIEWMARRGDIAHSAEARAAGFSRQTMADAVEQGFLKRTRRSWLIGPTADDAVVRAVAAGGRLSCVSAASRHGLWVPTHSALHIAVKPTASRVPREGLVAHWSIGPAPVGRYAAEDHLLNALLLVAECVSRDLALTVWESAVRRGLVQTGVLARVDWRSLPAREVADACSALSDSGLESIFLARIANLGVGIRQQVWVDGHPVDFLIGDRLIVQLDGFEHHSSPTARRRDMDADARLVLLGYTVLRFDYQQVMFEWEQVEAVLITAMAQRLHLADRRRA
jgi:very-short-patch-repair endonuclease